VPFLILVKHSLPGIEPNEPAASWRLSAEGRRRCKPLAGALAGYSPYRIFTSREPKAIETGRLVAGWLDLPCSPADGLHEHSRLTVPFTSQAEFEAGIARFFAQPEQLVLGEETAVQAETRFTTAVRGLAALHPQETLILVSHGTVISLFYQSVVGQDPFPLWRKLGLPSYLAFRLPDYSLAEIQQDFRSKA